LAHALGNDDRAEKCYKVAAFLSRKIGETKKLSADDKDAPTDNRDEGCGDHWVNVSARVGETRLRIGVLSRAVSSSSEARRRSEKAKPTRKKMTMSRAIGKTGGKES